MKSRDNPDYVKFQADQKYKRGQIKALKVKLTREEHWLQRMSEWVERELKQMRETEVKIQLLKEKIYKMERL